MTTVINEREGVLENSGETHLVAVGFGGATVYVEAIRPQPQEILIMLAKRQLESISVIYKDWQLASSVKCEHLPLRDGRLPWIYFSTPSEHIFANISTQETFSVSIHASLCYSRQGWLLFRLGTVGASLDEYRWDFFLLNPSTGARLDLPSMTGGHGGHAIFSVFSGGIPDYAFYVYVEGSYVFIRMARPGDDSWEMHRYRRFFSGHVTQLVLTGSCLHCFYDRGGHVFDVLTKHWSFLKVGSLSNLVEHRGEILMVGTPNPYYPRPDYTVWRLSLNGDRGTWVEMDPWELENTAFFLSDAQSFSVTGIGRKVFRFVRRDDICENGEDKKALTIHVYDHHAEGWACKRLVSDSFPFTPSHSWVDMGISR